MLAENIKANRLRMQLTQSGLAEKVGVTQQAVAHYEQGLSIPALAVAQTMAKVFKITLDELVK